MVLVTVVECRFQRTEPFNVLVECGKQLFMHKFAQSLVVAGENAAMDEKSNAGCWCFPGSGYVRFDS